MLKELVSIALSSALAVGVVTTPPHSTATDVTEVASPAALTAISYEDYEARRQLAEQNQVDSAFSQGVTDFSAQTSAGVLSGQENACYSPASLYFALSLSAAGAAGNTKTQLLNLLHADDTASLTQNCAKLYRLLYTENEIGKLQIANALWMDSGTNFAPDFQNTASQDFYTSLYTGKLTAPATISAMEQWVSDHTGGKIKPTIQPSDDSILYLMNTIYFKDEWISNFNPSQNTTDPFYLANGGTTTATFMHRSDIGSFVRGKDYISSKLAMKNRETVTFVLPNEGVSVQKLLDTEHLQEILSGSTEEHQKHGRVHWSIPKFSYDTKANLKNMLQNCGVTDLFEPNCADLSGMTSKPAWLSGASQQTYIALDENGVEAAAYTELGFAGSSMPTDEADMNLNRPFLYCIQSSDGTPLFVGVCGKPSNA